MAQAVAQPPGAVDPAESQNPRASGPAISSAPHPPRPIVDVWSRTEPKYRARAVVLLICNMILFSAVCVFTHWLHVGRMFDFSLSSYLENARFWGEQTRSLNDFVLYPINVVQTPVHGIVLGLLVASIVAVPILTSILYRFAYALPFVAAVVVFAHLPWMGFTLLGSCILAGLPPFRLNFRFGSALLGMLPVIVYLYLATRGSAEVIGSMASPTQKSLLSGPWVLAILAACTMMGLILLIAWIVNYRPGAVTPVVTIMFATPVLLFHHYVGVDELAYRVLETEYGPRSPRFESVQDPRQTQEKITSLMHVWTTDDATSTPFRSEFLAVWSGQVGRLKQRISQRFLGEFLVDRAAASDACQRFVSDHAGSRYTPNALYIQGTVLDMRLDERRLAETPPRRELYRDFPHVQSETAWSALVTQFPESPLAMAGCLRLAQLRLREGKVDGALEALATLLARGPALAARSTTQPGARSLLKAPPPESSLDLEAAPYLFEAQRLSELIFANRDDPQFGNRPLADLFALDPRRPRYSEQLQRLAEQYPGALLHDNLAVAWANAQPTSTARARALVACVDTIGEGDALPEALFRLADLEIQSLIGKDEAVREQGITRMRDVQRRFGATCWGRAASERLRMLEPTAARPADVSVLP